jgi:hypothetical protein
MGEQKKEKPRTYLQVIIRDDVDKVVVKMCATCRLMQHSLQVWMHVKKKKVTTFYLNLTICFQLLGFFGAG